MSGVKADAGVRGFDGILEEMRQRRRPAQIIRDDLDGNANAERFGRLRQRLDTPSRCVTIRAAADRVRARTPAREPPARPPLPA